MDNKENKVEGTEKEGCCGSAGSCGCGGHRCCGGKAALVLVLLLIGGLIGYAVGHCHSYRMGCSYPMGGHMEAPATPGK
jgi:hypothetical protein